MLCDDLTVSEARALMLRMEADRKQLDDLTLHRQADEFEDAWLEFKGNGVDSFKWALNNEQFPYRHRLAMLLVDSRLFGTPI